jgi:hypothetical protein
MKAMGFAKPLNPFYELETSDGALIGITYCEL